MQLTIEKLQMYLMIGIAAGEILAPMTETKIDDKAVALAKSIQANPAILALIVAVLSGDHEPDTSGLSESDQQTWAECEESMPNIAALVDVGQLTAA